MATYIPNVTDVFPEIQPFKPDYSFLQSALATKQAQYNAAFEQLNSVYGSVLNAPLTRGINQERRAEFLKAADNNIKKITSLDLSLPQNVQTASNVFKPFYDDKNLVWDMTWTKGWQSELQKAEALKDCNTEECKDQYWDTGVQALGYQRQDFSKASDEEAMRMGKASYTPYVNVQKKALDYLQKAGFDINTVEFKGNWIIKHQNGKVAVEPMYQYINAIMGTDPDVRKYYDTLEYVNYKSFINKNAETYGGEEQAAAVYADEILSSLPKEYNKYVTDLKNSYDRSKRRVAESEQFIKQNGVIPGSDDHAEYLEALKEMQLLGEANKAVDLDTYNIDKISDYVSKARSLAKQVAQLNDFKSAAQIGAYIKTDVDYTANPFELENLRHENNKKLEEYKKTLEQGEAASRALTIPVTPGGDIDLGESVDYNRNVISAAQSKNVEAMAALIGQMAPALQKKIVIDGKEISAEKLRQLATDKAYSTKIVDLFNSYNSAVNISTNQDLKSKYNTITEEAQVISLVNNKFNENFQNAFRSFQSTTGYEQGAGNYFNINALSKNGAPVSKDEYVKSYIDRLVNQISSGNYQGRFERLDTYGTGYRAPFSLAAPMGRYEKKTDVLKTLNYDAYRQIAAKEYDAIMSQVNKFVDKNSIYSAYADLYGSGQTGLGTGLMNVGATVNIYDPTVNDPQARSQMQSLINSYYRDPNLILARFGDASEKGSSLGDAANYGVQAAIERTFLDAQTASKGEGRYVTNIQYQSAVAGDPNMSAYTIRLSDDALKILKDSGSDFYEQAVNAGGVVNIQLPKGNDVNSLSISRMSIDPIKSRINLSDTRSYSFQNPDGGFATMTEIEPNVLSISGGYKTYDPVSGNYNITNFDPIQTVIESPGGYTAVYNNLNNQFSSYATQNLRQKKANTSTNGVKDPNLLR